MRKVSVLSLVLVAPLVLAPLVNAADLKEFKSDAGKFKVMMPGTPKEIPQKTPFGNLTMYVAMEGANSGYMAAYVDLPITGKEDDAAIQKRLDGAVQGAANSSRGKILNQSKIKLDNKYPGREMTLELGGGQAQMKGRIYLVGKRLYQVMAIGSKDFVNSAPAKKFLDSFALTK